jgi:hypothetical protein
VDKPSSTVSLGSSSSINSSANSSTISNTSSKKTSSDIVVDAINTSEYSDSFLTRFIADQNYIYFANYADKGKLYKLDKKTGKKTKLSDTENVRDMIITNQFLIIGTKGSTSYTINKNGTDQKKLLDSVGGSLIVNNGWLYYTTFPNPTLELWRYNFSTKQKEKLDKGEVETVSLAKDKLYYRRNNIIVMLDLKTNKKTEWKQDNSYLQYQAGKLYYENMGKKTVECLDPLSGNIKTIVTRNHEGLDYSLATKDYLFYTMISSKENAEKGIKDLFRCDLEGKNSVKIKSNLKAEGKFILIKVVDNNKLFLFSPDESKEYWAIDFNGKDLNIKPW